MFDVTYLGGHMPSFALNFSRPGAQVLLQYYLFLRLGWDGYYKVQKASQDVALYLSGEIAKMAAFDLWNDGSDIPVFAWQLTPGHTDKWNLYHLSERLRLKGWLIPAYPMPDDLTDIDRAADRGAERPQPQSRREAHPGHRGGGRLPRPSRVAHADRRPGVLLHALASPGRH